MRSPQQSLRYRAAFRRLTFKPVEPSDQNFTTVTGYNADLGRYVVQGPAGQQLVESLQTTTLALNRTVALDPVTQQVNYL